MNYCSICGSADLEQTVPAGDNRLRTVCRSCGRVHYENPKVVTGALITLADQILLCRRAIEPRAGYWTIPCGFLENRETLEEGAMRECVEEAHARIAIEHLHTIYSLPHINQLYLIFKAQLLNPDDIRATDESSEVRLFRYDELPWEELAFSSVKFALENLLSFPGHERAFRGSLPGDTKKMY